MLTGSLFPDLSLSSSCSPPGPGGAPASLRRLQQVRGHHGLQRRVCPPQPPRGRQPRYTTSPIVPLSCLTFPPGPIYNPLNPRSGSQRYQKHKGGRIAPLPGPSIHECGLPSVSGPAQHIVSNGSGRGHGVMSNGHGVIHRSASGGGGGGGGHGVIQRSASASDLGSEVSLQVERLTVIWGRRQYQS